MVMDPKQTATSQYPVYKIQNADRAITSAKYKHLDGKLLMTSLFRTIQGEGIYAGYPAIFLRLAGCNFGAKDTNCQWCDTAFEYDKGIPLTYVELANQILMLPGYNANDILVVTGGEPTLQHNLIAFMKFVEKDRMFRAIQIETNGTQGAFFKAFNEEYSMYEQLKDAFSGEGRMQRPYVCVSPKASYVARRYSKLSDATLKEANCLKFVLEADPESPHYTVPHWAFDWLEEKTAGRVHNRALYVSPMAVYAKPYKGEVSSIWTPGLIDKKRTAANYAYAAKYALEQGILISIQQHLFLGVA